MRKKKFGITEIFITFTFVFLEVLLALGVIKFMYLVNTVTGILDIYEMLD
jgi:hypothetical protein